MLSVFKLLFQHIFSPNVYHNEVRLQLTQQEIQEKNPSEM